MNVLYCLPCSATKARTLEAGPLPARDAYTGQAFRMLRQTMEREKLKWCILSGGYGFLWPTSVIEWYDEKMRPLRKDEPWDDCFEEMNQRQYGQLMNADVVSVLGSRLYADVAEELLVNRSIFRGEVRKPLAGLPIGKMLQAIHRREWLI